MCGLFGAIGADINPYIVRALAIVNRERGTDSIGFFDNFGTIVKLPVDPLKALRLGKFCKFLQPRRGRWFIAGHTRYATRGKVTGRNAHPFEYGRVIGSHNGCVDCPDKYVVDSEFLFDTLDKHNNDYQALADISGYWSLSWLYGKSLFLSVNNNTLETVTIGETVYYSSDRKHLRAVTGVTPTPFVQGETRRYTKATCTVLPDFVGSAAPRARSFKTVKTVKTDTAGHWWDNDEYMGYGGRKSYLSHTEYAKADELAMATGYGGFYEFCRVERCSERAGYNLLTKGCH